MKIRHRGIHHTRFDAPFCGALISAISCNRGCRGCINDSLKHGEGIITESLDSIMDQIVSNPFNKGIILGGLEWTLQPRELLAIVDRAFDNGLEVILYTYHTEDSLRNAIPSLYDTNLVGDHIYKGLYIKYGEYDDTKLSDTHSSYGVPLASTNQYIVRLT